MNEAFTHGVYQHKPSPHPAWLFPHTATAGLKLSRHLVTSRHLLLPVLLEPPSCLTWKSAATRENLRPELITLSGAPAPAILTAPYLLVSLNPLKINVLSQSISYKIPCLPFALPISTQLLFLVTPEKALLHQNLNSGSKPHSCPFFIALFLLNDTKPQMS